MKQLRLIIAALFLLSPFAANADFIDDTIDTNFDVDYHFFTSSGGTASFNMWARGFMGSGLDVYIRLFVNDGSLPGALTGAQVAANDDSGFPGWNSDGSTSTLDSFLPSLNLSAGDYVLAVGAYSLSEAAARAGANDRGVVLAPTE